MELNFEQRSGLSYHYEFVGFTNFKKVFKQLCESLKFYRFSKMGKCMNVETFFDVPSHILSEGGIVISKRIENEKATFNLRKLNLFKSIEVKSNDYLYCSCGLDDLPKDYAFAIASKIVSSYSSPFTVDLESIVRQTMPIIQVDTNYDRYEIIGGTGFRGFMQYEVTTYRDPQSGKKVEREGITLKFPTGECKETEEILSTIERCIKGLALYNLSRFEIARDLLFNGTEEKKVEKRPNTVQNEEED